MNREDLIALVTLLAAALLAWLLGPLAHVGAAYLPFVAAVVLATAAAGTVWGLLVFGLGAALPFLFPAADFAPMGHDPASPYTLTLYALAALPACVATAVWRRRTQRQQLELASLEGTFEHMADGLITTDAATRVQRMNRSAEHLTGWRAREARDKPLSQVLRFARRGALSKTAIEQAVGADAERSTLIASDGSERPVMPLVAADGTGGQVILLRDVAGWERTERELRTRIGELWQANRDKDAALAALAGARGANDPTTTASLSPMPAAAAAPCEYRPEPDTQPAEIASQPPPEQRVLMLCADDDSAYALSMLLGLAGYDVQTANSADDALRRAALFSPQVALVDVDMVDGAHFARALRRLDPALQLVALTRADRVPDTKRLAAEGYTIAVPKTEPLALKHWLAGTRAA